MKRNNEFIVSVGNEGGPRDAFGRCFAAHETNVLAAHLAAANVKKATQ